MMENNRELIDRDLRQLHRAMAFIEDVKGCEACDTSNMSKVIYCEAHHRYLFDERGLDG